MAGASIEIRNQEVREALDRLERVGQKPEEAFDEIGLAMVSATVRRFEEGKGPDGQAWLPSRRAKKEGGKTLIDTARLMQSITYAAGATSVAWGTNLVYAAIHQFGGAIQRKARSQVVAFDARGRFASRRSTRRRKSGSVPIAFAQVQAGVITLPARPYLGVSQEDENTITRIFARRIEGKP